MTAGHAKSNSQMPNGRFMLLSRTDKPGHSAVFSIFPVADTVKTAAEIAEMIVSLLRQSGL
jgi:hypothetical protein